MKNVSKISKNFYFKIVLDLQKNFEDTTEILYTPYSIAPIINTSMEYLSQLMNKYWYIIINWSLYSNFPSFYLTIFFCSKISCKIAHYI